MTLGRPPLLLEHPHHCSGSIDLGFVSYKLEHVQIGRRDMRYYHKRDSHTSLKKIES